MTAADATGSEEGGHGIALPHDGTPRCVQLRIISVASQRRSSGLGKLRSRFHCRPLLCCAHSHVILLRLRCSCVPLPLRCQACHLGLHVHDVASLVAVYRALGTPTATTATATSRFT